jgi:endonuclease YncB( thermonuclease family)
MTADRTTMTADRPSLFLNIALAAGVTLALALGAGFALFYRQADLTFSPAPSQSALEDRHAVYISIPPRAPTPPQPVPSAPADNAVPVTEAAASPPSEAQAPPPTASSDSPTAPNEVAPAPNAVAPAPNAVAATPNAVADEPSSVAQAPSGVAARSSDPPFESPPPAITPPKTAPAANNDTPVTVKEGDPLPALRTVELEDHDIHRVPDRDQPVRTVTVLNRKGKVIAVERGQGAKTTAKKDGVPSATDAALGKLGTKLSGRAVVTGTLELNLGGRPLRLFGLKPPDAADMCDPGPNFAARACTDVSRFTLATHLEKDARVTCHLLAVDGRSMLPAVCSDENGTDLGSYLVAHGLALAESNDMVDYTVVQNQAHLAGLGLWHYRE